MAVVWTATLGTSANNFQNYCIRTVAGSLSGGGDEVRVRFIASASQGLFVDNASIGVLGGATAPNCTTNPPVELKFGGASGFTVGAGGSIVSDWASLPFLSTDTLIVTADHGATASGHKEGSLNSGSVSWFRAAYNGYNLATVSGMSSSAAGYVRGIDQIEGQFVSGGQPLIKRLGGVPFEARNGGVW
ncbi:MAG: hypothetical protein AB7S74_18765 [Hyphomicrobium sp.]